MKLTVSQIFSDTFAAMKEHFWGLIGLWLTFFVIIIVVVFGFFAVMGGSAMLLAGAVDGDSAGGLGALGGGFLGMLLVFYLIYILLICAQTAALNAMASPLRRAGFGEAFGLGWRSSPTLLVVMILFLIGYFAASLVAGAIIGVLASLGTAVAILMAVLALLAVLYLACRLLVVFPVVPVEGLRNPITAIARSWGLTRGNALPIFLALLVFVLLAIVAFGALLVPFFGMSMSMNSPEATPAVGSFLAISLGFVILSVVFAVMYAAFLSAIHGRLAGGTGEQLSETFE